MPRRAGESTPTPASVRHLRRDSRGPSFLRKENARHVPVNALWLSNGLIQLFLIITLFNASTYLSLLYLATSMILVPYFWSAAYALLLGVRGEGYANAAGERRKDTLIAAVATLYAVWLVYAGGIQYLLLSALLYAPGHCSSPRPSANWGSRYSAASRS